MVDRYPTRKEKAAALLYMIVKSHPFVDGNKRIGVCLFLNLLCKNRMLNTAMLSKDEVITDYFGKAMANLALFVGSSAASDKDKVIAHTTRFTSTM